MQVKGERSAVEEVSSSTSQRTFFHNQNRFTEQQLQFIEGQAGRFPGGPAPFPMAQNRFSEGMRAGVLAGPLFNRTAGDFCKADNRIHIFFSNTLFLDNF
jgi:hypothetical protein